MAVSAALPSLYEYYTMPRIHSGLNSDKPYFTLNDRNITIYSGAMHYFRVPRAYWRDRLRRMRAAGLNTVETYVPWNLHEPQEGKFDFGEGGHDMSDFLHLEEFLKTAQEEDLFAILRPGPFICSEWEFGGFPSWLLRYKGIKVRTSQQMYMQHVTRYFNVLLKLLALFQFTLGGPIIAFQVENEYGSTEAKNFKPDKVYLEELRQLFINNGIVEQLVTSDSPTQHGDRGTLPQYFLQMANFAGSPDKEFDQLKVLQGNRPIMAMEFWAGWFDHWSEVHHTRKNTAFQQVLEQILRYPASVNMYMFHGGTNFGFLNGANIADNSIDNKGYQPTTTSYDYDAPLSEAGDYTDKYVTVKELIHQYSTIKVRTPQTPKVNLRIAYQSIPISGQLTYEEILSRLPYKFERSRLMPMEYLPMNNNSGQSYGYIIYRKKNLVIPPGGGQLKISGRICDTLMVLQDGVLVTPPLQQSKDLNGPGYWRIKNTIIALNASSKQGSTIDLIIENWGRNNFGKLEQFMQLKGLWQGPVKLDDKIIYDWEIYPMEFKSSWTNSLTGWHPVHSWQKPKPALYKAVLRFEDEPSDTYVDMSNWTKGIVMINGFVLGRHAVIGPQQSLYLPAPFLKRGDNEIVIFEHFYANQEVQFARNPIFKTV
ncbi:beta-galactosidase-1-like protein 3 [Atheta coriaria]|uniref:beta-galactosidase-1-like protein 3 n=1 Tax=Dalotia coriaria TaxID=877792 RepID=UPI0031F390A1